MSTTPFLCLFHGREGVQITVFAISRYIKSKFQGNYTQEVQISAKSAEV